MMFDIVLYLLDRSKHTIGITPVLVQKYTQLVWSSTSNHDTFLWQNKSQTLSNAIKYTIGKWFIILAI